MSRSCFIQSYFIQHRGATFTTLRPMKTSARSCLSRSPKQLGFVSRFQIDRMQRFVTVCSESSPSSDDNSPRVYEAKSEIGRFMQGSGLMKPEAVEQMEKDPMFLENSKQMAALRAARSLNDEPAREPPLRFTEVPLEKDYTPPNLRDAVNCGALRVLYDSQWDVTTIFLGVLPHSEVSLNDVRSLMRWQRPDAVNLEMSADQVLQILYGAGSNQSENAPSDALKVALAESLSWSSVTVIADATVSLKEPKPEHLNNSILSWPVIGPWFARRRLRALKSAGESLRDLKEVEEFAQTVAEGVRLPLDRQLVVIVARAFIVPALIDQLSRFKRYSYNRDPPPLPPSSEQLYIAHGALDCVQRTVRSLSREEDLDKVFVNLLKDEIQVQTPSRLLSYSLLRSSDGKWETQVGTSGQQQQTS
mmetsp:Transcript_16150/g.26422  ORF Transcript_16150/g.26422 Transcript_16150/m.26422 type:complete len:418 (+) Transcript_16150:131-1384(+)